MEDKLRALSRKQAAEPASKKTQNTKAKLRQLLFRGIPWAAAIVAVLLVWQLFGERLLPAAAVDVEPVVTMGVHEGSADDVQARGKPAAEPFSGEALFQASGWFEADPFPYRATALASGVVETVHVLEGQEVKAGEPIATLIREDAELRLNRARAALEAARAALLAARSEYDLSHARVESMRRQIDVAMARREELADLAARAKELGPEVLSMEEIIQSGLRLKTQDETIGALEAQLREREIETKRLAGQLQVREGELSAAEVRHSEAELEFERMVVRSPVDGIIQRLMVAPGQKKVLMADHPESATVAVLFEPDSLQARVDVPLAEASRLFTGQAVIVESEFLPGMELRGYVQRIVGEADLQRNTLQAKVRIEAPPPGLRPEILCRARFLATRVDGAADPAARRDAAATNPGGQSRLGVLVPEAALVGRNGNEATVWAVDTGGRRVERRQLLLGSEEREGYVAVRDGLRPGDRVVISPSPDLRDGKRIQF